MTAQTIYRWLKTLPDHLLPALVLGSRDTHVQDDLLTNPLDDWDAQRFALAYRRPDLGWNYMALLAKHHLPFPGWVSGDDRLLFRAYCYHINPTRYRNESLIQAMGLLHADLSHQRAVVESLLLAPDATPQQVSRLSGLPEGVVRMYERLFFNVLDRRNDALYLMKLVYPHGRTVELMQNYLNNETFRALIRRVGYNEGTDHVLYQAGISNDLVRTLTSATSAQQMESLLMANGYVLAKSGLANLSAGKVPSIFHAQRLLAAGKIGGEDNSGGSEAGLWGDALYTEMSAYANEQLQRIQLSLTEEMVSLEESGAETLH